MRKGAQPFLWKWVWFAWEWKMISISKAERLPSFWNRGPGTRKWPINFLGIAQIFGNLVFTHNEGQNQRKKWKKKLTPRMILVPFASTWRKFLLLLIWRRLFSDEAKSKTIAFKNPGNLLNTSTRQNSSSTGWLVQRFAHCIYKADGSLKRKMSLSWNEMTQCTKQDT